jgi:hypothetical protein
MRGIARGLIRLQLAEATVDGALQVAFVAGELGEGIGTGAIGVEGAGQEVTLGGRSRRWRRGLAVLLGPLLCFGVLFFAGLVLGGDILEAVAKDASFQGDGALQAPLIKADAQDQLFFAFADRTEAAEEVLEEEHEDAGIIVVEQVLVGARGAGDAVAAGFGFAFGGSGSGRLFRILAVGVDLSFSGHVDVSGRVCGPTSIPCYAAGLRGAGSVLAQVVESTGKMGFARLVTEDWLTSRLLGR